MKISNQLSRIEMRAILGGTDDQDHDGGNDAGCNGSCSGSSPTYDPCPDVNKCNCHFNAESYAGYCAIDVH